MIISILKSLIYQDTASEKIQIIRIVIDKYPPFAEQVGVGAVRNWMLFKQGGLIWRKSKVVLAHLVMQKILKHA